MAKKAKQESEEARLLRFTELQKTIRLGIGGLVVLGLGYFALQSVKEMAGKSTSFRSVIDWGLRLGFPAGLALVVIAVLSGSTIMALRSRRKMAAQAGPRLAILEAEADRNRTSSELRRADGSTGGAKRD